VVNSEQQLAAILAILEECRVALVTNGNPETAHLVSLAVLDIRMKLGGIGEGELIALSEAMLLSELEAEGLRGGRSAPRRHALLRLVSSR
jgi:hypothetical protein